MMTNDEHYVPVIIKDVIDKLNRANKNTNDFHSALAILIATKRMIDKEMKKRNINV